MRPLFSKTIAANDFAAIVQEHHAKHFASLRNKCIHKILKLVDSPANPFSADDRANLPHFSAIDDQAGYNDRCPTGKYYLAVYKRYIGFLRPYHLMTVQLGGIPPTLQIDHSKKIIKHLAHHQGEPIFSSLFTAACSATGKVRYVRKNAFAQTRCHTRGARRLHTWRLQVVHTC